MEKFLLNDLAFPVNQDGFRQVFQQVPDVPRELSWW